MAFVTDAPTYPTVLKTLHYPDPLLRVSCAPIATFDQALADFAQVLLEHMYAEHGIGLAAPQVGVPYRLFVTDHDQQAGQPGEPRIWINPRIEHSCGESVYEEGCLSVPGLYAKVRRHDRFELVYQDLKGDEQRQAFDVGAGDLLGTVVQHERDHLDGTLFVDHLNPLQLKLLRRRLRGMEKAYKHKHGKAGTVLRR